MNFRFSNATYFQFYATIHLKQGHKGTSACNQSNTKFPLLHLIPFKWAAVLSCNDLANENKLSAKVNMINLKPCNKT